MDFAIIMAVLIIVLSVVGIGAYTAGERHFRKKREKEEFNKQFQATLDQMKVHSDNIREIFEVLQELLRRLPRQQPDKRDGKSLSHFQDY